MFQANFGEACGAFGLPNEVVDVHLKLSGALSLKVLLVLFRTGRPMTTGELAQVLSQNEGDIKDALNQWLEAGLVIPSGEQTKHTPVAVQQKPSLSSGEEPPVAAASLEEKEPRIEPYQPPAESPAEEAETPEPVSPNSQVKVERFRRMTRHDVNEISQTDSGVGVLIQESQNILVRPLSNGESEMLVSFYHYYGLDVDVLLMLLTYCKMKGKDTAGYIERMASDWVNREINTHERAEAELVRLTQRDENEGKIRRIFGIHNRSLSKREVELFEVWSQEYGFDEKMIQLAHERTIDSKGDLSFPYTNAILKAWHEKGFQTPAEAEQEGRGEAPSKTGDSSGSNASYDLSKMEELTKFGSVWD